VSNPPRPWPNVAKEVRDRAAEAAAHGIREMEPLLIAWTELTETEKLRRVATGLNDLQRIARLLESVGACTRP
jgi:hypothetical protein